MVTQEIKYETPIRAWINAASKNNPYHKYHGKNGIVHQRINSLGYLITTIYFTEGSMSNMVIDPLYIETKNSQNNNLKY